MVRRVFVALAAAAAAGCASRAAAPAHPAPRFSLEFVAASIVPRPGAGDPLLAARFGGISGITFDPATGELLGISDDTADSRVFIFTVSKPGAPFEVRLKAYFPLPQGPGADTLDAEGIAMSPDGRLFVASEGFANREPRIPPGLFEYSRRVEYRGQIALPARFSPPATGALSRGVPDNRGFESLTMTPDGRLFVGSESALAQDGEQATPARGTLARIVELAPEGRTFAARREFAYPVDPVATPPFAPGFFVSGLAELLAIDATTLLALERSYAEERRGGPSQYRIRLFLVTLDGATDIAAVESLRGARGVRPVRKTLLADLDTVRARLPPELAALDNFEGMAVGAPLPDGSQPLLLVSDDNFSDSQRTAFLLFHLRGFKPR